MCMALVPRNYNKTLTNKGTLFVCHRSQMASYSVTSPLEPIMSDFSQVTVDEVRTYWDRRPCNLRHSPKPVGSREYFDEVEARKYFVEPHIPRFAEFERWRGKRVL